MDYSLFATPSWLDTVVSALRMLVSIREELRVLLRKEELIRDELRTTTQRTNLFEKKLIPELKENIRKIRIFLGDERPLRWAGPSWPRRKSSRARQADDC